MLRCPYFRRFLITITFNETLYLCSPCHASRDCTAATEIVPSRIPQTVPPKNAAKRENNTTKSDILLCFFVFCRGFWWYGFGVRLGTVLDGSWCVCGGFALWAQFCRLGLSVISVIGNVAPLVTKKHI